LNLNWDADDTTSFVPHPSTGSMTLDLLSGLTLLLLLLVLLLLLPVLLHQRCTSLR
jgi:hypothetical protein